MSNNDIVITKDFTGGNISVVRADGDTIILKNELRDTQCDWFYWAFCVENAGGRTLKFCFDSADRVGYFGAAVSHNLRDFKWSRTKINENGCDGFVYSFKEDENHVYFAHNMLYHPDRFLRLAAEKNIQVKQLCTSEKGRNIPYIIFGHGDKHIILTSRHHCCEATGSYVLEGVLESLISSPVDGYTVFCVPFVDYDGVIDGDQGKQRFPHDHNRDYDPSCKPVYKSTAAIMEYALSHNTVLAFDFHSPWHCGEENDHIAIPKISIENLKNINAFSGILKQCMKAPALQYTADFDTEPGERWNKLGTPTFARFITGLPGSSVAFTLETPYFGTPEDPFTAEKAIETGKCFATAIRRYITEKAL